MKITPSFVKTLPNNLLLLGVGLALITSALLPTLMPRSANAAQIDVRSLEISSGLPSATSVTYTFGDGTTGFKFGTSHIVRAMKFEACTTAVGSCSAPAGLSFASSGGYTLTNWQDATAFTKDTTNQNDCDGTGTSRLCLSRAGASTPENTTGFHKIVVTGMVNPSGTNTAFFIRMTTYTNATYTVGTITDTGTVASATTQSTALTVNAAVAEVLNFCVGSTTRNASTGGTQNNGSSATDCSQISGTGVNIGTLDTGSTNVSPVNTNGGTNLNGVAMIRTNAVNGATVEYKAVQQSGSNHVGTLRISGATCNATDTDITDQCIRAQGTSQGAFTAGTERFGMTVAGVNCDSTSSYSCVFTTNTYNLKRDAAYDGDGLNTDTGTFADTGAVGGTTTMGYAWDDTGTFDIVATSTGSATKVIDDEALILKFAATPSITTPFGPYAAQADFVAVATY